MNEEKGKIFEFGEFRLESDERRLLHDQKPVSVTPKVFELLRLLVENRGRLLTKEHLIATLWQDSFVEEANLNVNISTLRRVLGESRSERRFIETVPRQGYRFVAEVREITEGKALETPRESDAAAQPTLTLRTPVSRCSHCGHIYYDDGLRYCRQDGAALESVRENAAPTLSHLRLRQFRAYRRPAAIAAIILLMVTAAVVVGVRLRRSRANEAPGIRSIAILPFKPLVHDQADAALQLGMADAMITRLGRLQQLTVRPTSAVSKYLVGDVDALAAGRELQVDAVLDGKIQRSGDRIRITVQLLRVADGKSLWAGSFDDFFTNVFAVQDSISEKMTESLSVKLSGRDKELLAQRHTENTEAYRLYLDGRYQWEKRTIEGLQRAIDYFQRAIALDPEYSSAYAGLADCYSLLSNYDTVAPQEPMQRAKAMAQQALSLDDSLAEAHTSLGLVKKDYDWDLAGAEQEFQRAIQLDPSYATAWHWYAETLVALGRFDEAAKAIRRAHELDPQSLAVMSKTAWVLSFQDAYDEAIARCREVLARQPAFWLARLYLGMIYTRQARYPEALAELDEAAKLYPGNVEAIAHIGYVKARQGNKAGAQQELALLQDLSRRKYVTPLAEALIRTGLGEKERAIEALERAGGMHDSIAIYYLQDPEFASLRSEPRYQAWLGRIRVS